VAGEGKGRPWRLLTVMATIVLAEAVRSDGPFSTTSIHSSRRLSSSCGCTSSVNNLGRGV